MILTLFLYASFLSKRDDIIGILYPTQIKNFLVEQCHIPSVNPTPLCQKTYQFELLGANVVPAQVTGSPYTGNIYMCIFKEENYVQDGSVWRKEISYSKITYKIDIPVIKNVVEIRLYIGESGKRGLPVANLIQPKDPGNTKVSFMKTGTLKQEHLFQYDSLRYYDLKDVARAVERGVAYVSVNTDNGYDEDNSYPGNYIMGEIRGQGARDCGSKCTCGVVPLAANCVGEPTSLEAGLNDLYRGTS